MKIDMEQFLAVTVALGCAGAVGFAVYSDRAQMNEIIAGVEDARDVPEPAVEEPSVAQEVAATVIAPSPMPAGPIDLDEAAGIPPVIPDADDASAYAPGPDSETAG